MRTQAISKRLINLDLDEFGHAHIRASARRHELTLSEFLQAAVRRLATSSRFDCSWRVPQFRRQGVRLVDGHSRPLKVTLQLSDEDWHALEAESTRQSVLLESLVQHAALRLLAALDAGSGS